MDKETGMGLALSLIDEDASAPGFAGATTAATMMAIAQRRYGQPDVLEYTAVDKPVVGDDDVLVRVHAAAVHPGDYFLMTGVPYIVRLAFGLRRPRNGVRGMDLAGPVEAVGRNVQGLEPGDEVFGWSTTGTLAEYACAPADNFAPKPANLTVEQAAAQPHRGGSQMATIVGVDPHKHVLSAVALDERGGVLGSLNGAMSARSLNTLLRWAAELTPTATWAIEGSNNLGRRLALALTSAGADVRDVCPTRTADRRRQRPGRGKSDVVDAEVIARELLAHPDLPRAFKSAEASMPDPVREELTVLVRA
jgi:hypothetical protein